MPIGKVTGISSDRGGFVVRLDSQEHPLIATSQVIRSALLTAFLVGARVDVDVFEGTNIAERINAFDVNKQARRSQISRLATQLNGTSGFDLLEVFVAQADGSEKVFQAIDKVVQVVCCCAALAKADLVLALRDSEIVGASFPPPDLELPT